jgi:DNA-directed RNA polymerase specialized sigma subunit
VDEESEGAKLFNALRELNFPSLSPQRPWVNITSKDWTRSKNSERKLNVHRNSRYQFTPATEIQSIMETAPYEQSMRSMEERERDQEDLIIAIHETFMRLTENEQWLYHMLVDVGLSLRFVAIVLDIPKTTLARRRDELANKLRQHLLEDPKVRDYLTREM